MALTRHRHGVQLFYSTLDFVSPGAFMSRLSQSAEKLAALDYRAAVDLNKMLAPSPRLQEVLTQIGETVTQTLEGWQYMTRQTWQQLCDRFLGTVPLDAQIRVCPETVTEVLRARELGINQEPWDDDTSSPSPRSARGSLRPFFDRETLVSTDLTPAQHQAEQRLHKMYRLWQSAQKAEGTLAEQYIRSSLGPASPLASDLRFLPTYQQKGHPRSFPTLVAVLRTPSHQVTGVQLMALDPHTAQTALLAKPLTVIGDIQGTLLCLQRGEGPIVVGFSLESALKHQAKGHPGPLYVCPASARFDRLLPFFEGTSQPILLVEEDTADHRRHQDHARQILTAAGHRVICETRAAVSRNLPVDIPSPHESVEKERQTPPFLEPLLSSPLPSSALKVPLADLDDGTAFLAQLVDRRALLHPKRAGRLAGTTSSPGSRGGCGLYGCIKSKSRAPLSTVTLVKTGSRLWLRGC